MRGMLLRYAAAAAFAAGTIVAQAQPPPGPQDQQQWQQRHAFKMNQIAQLLELTPAQQNQAQAIIQQGMQAAGPLMRQLRQNRREMKQLIESGNTAQFNQQVQQYAQEQGQIYGRLAEIKARATEQFYALLNPQQRQKAVALHNLSMGRRHGWD